MLENHSQFPSLTFTMTDSGPIDWDLIQTIDPIYLRSSNGIDSMKLIAQQFLRATTVPIENQTLILKLLQVLQVIVGYLCTSQDKFADLLNKKETENQQLKEIIESKSQDFIIGVQCPVCNKLFKSIFFLDKHFFKSHQNMANLWQGIRMSCLVNQPQFCNNFFPIEQFKPLTPTESEDIQKTLKEIQKELKHKHHNKEKHIQHKFENRISDVENEIVKLKTISEPLLKYQTQVQPPPQQAQLLIQQPHIPQMVVQTIPIQRHVEIEPIFPSNSNDNNQIAQEKSNTHHSHHKHRISSRKTSSQPILVQKATSPFAKENPHDNLIGSDSYNTSSDESIKDTKAPLVKKIVHNKYDNQNSNSTKEKQTTKINNEKQNLNDNKAKKKIRKKIKPTIESVSTKNILDQNRNTNQQQTNKNATPTQDIAEKNNKKAKMKEITLNKNSIKIPDSKHTLSQNNNNLVAQNTEKKTENSKPNFGIIWTSPPTEPKKANIMPDSGNTISDDEDQGEIEVGIIKRDDYFNDNNALQNTNKNTNEASNPYMLTESDREITITTKKNILVSPQDTFSMNKNISENSAEVQIHIPNNQVTTVKCVKSLPTQSPVLGLNSSIPSISSDQGSPYSVRTRNKSLLQEMTSESDSKLFLAFDKK